LGRWKALHRAARRFYAPLLLSIEDEPSTQGIYLTSDLRDCREGHVRTLNFADHLSNGEWRGVITVAELWRSDQRLAMQVASFVPT
jgi:beta-mannosidase